MLYSSKNCPRCSTLLRIFTLDRNRELLEVFSCDLRNTLFESMVPSLEMLCRGPGSTWSFVNVQTEWLWPEVNDIMTVMGSQVPPFMSLRVMTPRTQTTEHISALWMNFFDYKWFNRPSYLPLWIQYCVVITSPHTVLCALAPWRSVSVKQLQKQCAPCVSRRFI